MGAEICPRNASTAALARQADRDVLRDQGRRFAERLKALGVRVRYERPPGSTHLFITVPSPPPFAVPSISGSSCITVGGCSPHKFA